MNDLHRSLLSGCRRRALTLIESETIDVNQLDEKGGAPLIYAAMRGYSNVVHALLARGAETTVVNETGFDALHASSMNGDAATALALVEAGADLETMEKSTGATSLHMAAQVGNCEVVEVLVGAGARVDRETTGGETALYFAATRGHSRVVTVLLGAKANPSRKCSGFTPLESAAKLEHAGVVRAMLQQVGVDRCGGTTRGENSLVYAAQQRNVAILTILSNGGAVDRCGQALCAAVTIGHEEGVKFLLKKKQDARALDRYVNFARDGKGLSPIQCCFLVTSLRLFSCRIVRRLLDAGAEVDTVFLFYEVNNSAAEFADAYTRRARNVSDDQVRGLEAVRRLVRQVDAARSVSWGWPRVSTFRVGAAKKKATTTALSMRPMARPMARKPLTLRRALFRCVEGNGALGSNNCS